MKSKEEIFGLINNMDALTAFVTPFFDSYTIKQEGDKCGLKPGELFDFFLNVFEDTEMRLPQEEEADKEHEGIGCNCGDDIISFEHVVEIMNCYIKAAKRLDEDN